MGKARQVADALGVSMAGVHRLSCGTTGLDNQLRFPHESPYLARARMKHHEALERLELSHTTTLRVTVTARRAEADQRVAEGHPERPVSHRRGCSPLGFQKTLVKFVAWLGGGR